MKLSIYTFIKNGLYFDFHVEAMLKHHLPLADEIIINEGYSTDDTMKVISNIDPKIKIFQSHWNKPKDTHWFVAFKEMARLKASGDWCILLDCDEFIPEWDFQRIRETLENTEDIMIPVDVINFYGNYKVYNSNPERVNWPTRKMIIHKNIPDIEIWGDGSNIRLKNEPFAWGDSDSKFTVHHFGFVRKAARLREKWSILSKAYLGKKIRIKIPSFLFDIFPHHWEDPEFFQDLRIYKGQPVKAVIDDSDEFVRDNFYLLKRLENRVDMNENQCN